MPDMGQTRTTNFSSMRITSRHKLILQKKKRLEYFFFVMPNSLISAAKMQSTRDDDDTLTNFYSMRTPCKRKKETLKQKSVSNGIRNVQIHNNIREMRTENKAIIIIPLQRAPK